MIELEVLGIKADIDKLYMIFLLKKNIRADIIKTILGYPPIVVSKILKKWKMVITSVGQGYELMEGWYDYRTSIGMTYGGWGIPMNIGKTKNNYNKEGRPKCFNYNKYRHMVKKCWKSKEKNPRKCFKCERVDYITKDCKEK